MLFPAESRKPLLLVDVDGVLSLFGFESPPLGGWLMVDGIAHLISTPAGAHLRELGEHFELAWCSGWEEKANDYLPTALGLAGPLPHVPLSDHGRAARGGEGHWKLPAIDAFAPRDRPLAWIDDDHAGAHGWAAARPAPTLLVTVPPHSGLTAAEAERLKAWSRALAGDPERGGKR